MPVSRRVLLASLATPALAQAQSTRPLRVVVPFGVGGLTDVVARILAEYMGPALGRVMVIENQGGAGSTIGAATAARAAPDGNTIMVGSVGHAAMKALYANFAFDPIASFAPVALPTRQPFALVVHPSVPATDVPSWPGCGARTGRPISARPASAPPAISRRNCCASSRASPSPSCPIAPRRRACRTWSRGASTSWSTARLWSGR